MRWVPPQGLSGAAFAAIGATTPTESASATPAINAANLLRNFIVFPIH